MEALTKEARDTRVRPRLAPGVMGRVAPRGVLGETAAASGPASAQPRQPVVGWAPGGSFSMETKEDRSLQLPASARSRSQPHGSTNGPAGGEACGFTLMHAR